VSLKVLVVGQCIRAHAVVTYLPVGVNRGMICRHRSVDIVALAALQLLGGIVGQAVSYKVRRSLS